MHHAVRSTTYLPLALTVVALCLSACDAEGSAAERGHSAVVAAAAVEGAAVEGAVVEGAVVEAAVVRTKATAQHKPRTHLVASVIDGDTIELANGKTVRLVGIDTPEVGQCHYVTASNKMARLVGGKRVTLTISDENTDRYGRLLRYVNIGSMDAGLRMIKSGLAIARYDSRDGYGYHPREPIYIKADKASPNRTCATPTPTPTSSPTPSPGGDCHPNYSPCLPIVDDLDCGDIDGPVTVIGGADPYRLDGDGDGVGCE